MLNHTGVRRRPLGRPREARGSAMASETWKQVSVYIASGYFDMEGERIELFDRVLPELRQMCVPLRVQVHFIDLRQGLSEHQVPPSFCHDPWTPHEHPSRSPSRLRLSHPCALGRPVLGSP